MGSKKRFIVQLEWTDSWTELSDEEMGILFRNFISYAKDEELNFTNRIVNVSWKSIQPDIDRMNATYDKDVANGKKGGARLGNKNASKKPIETQQVIEKPKLTYHNLNNPKTTQEQPKNDEEKQPLNNLKTTPNQPKINLKTTYKEKDKDKDKDKDIEKQIIEVLNTGEKNETKDFYTRYRNDIEFIRSNFEVGLNEAMDIHRENLELNVFNNL
jgi:hypothetical protein